MEGKLKGRLGDILEEDRIAKKAKLVKKVASKKLSKKKLKKKKK